MDFNIPEGWNKEVCVRESLSVAVSVSVSVSALSLSKLWLLGYFMCTGTNTKQVPNKGLVSFCFCREPNAVARIRAHTNAACIHASKANFYLRTISGLAH